MAVASYRDLAVGKKAIDFVVETYKLTGHLPRVELYGLVSQLQRAVVSIPSNIAEGAGRLHTREYIQHVGIARGSLFEAETQIIVANRLGYATDEEVRPLLQMIDEVGRMIQGLITALERRLNAERP